MNLSFKPSHAGVSLWWAIAWRSLAVATMLFIPLVAVIISIQLAMAVGLAYVFSISPAVGLGATIGFVLLNVFVQWFLIPVTVYAFVFRWLFKKGSFGNYNITGKYLGQPATLFGKAFKFSAWFFLQNFKYIWPLFAGGILVGLLADEQGRFPAYVNAPLVMFLPLSIYLYMLILTDLIRRRTFSKLELIVTPRADAQTFKPFENIETKPQPATPVAKAVVVAPVAKVATQPVVKPAAKAKPVVKPLAKPAAKAAPKPVAKPKKK